MFNLGGFFKKAGSIGKKVILVLAAYMLILALFSYFIGKDKSRLTVGNSVEKNRQEIYAVINDPTLKKTPQGKLTIALYKTSSCFFMGEACTNNPADGDKNFNKSFLGFVDNLIMLPYANPPASGVTWAANGLANAGFIPKIYAAEGIGMGSIQPFAKIWAIFRDATYMLLVVIIIAIGFMVMFRTKINAQTVISVENSLPRIIIALILITFSFPLAGFLIDLMYLLIALIISLLGPIYHYGGVIGSPQNTAQLQQYFINAGPGAIYRGIGQLNSPGGNIMWNLPNAILGVVPSFGYTVKIVGGLILTYAALAPIQSFLMVLQGSITNLVGAFRVAFSPGGIGADVGLKELSSVLVQPLNIAMFIAIVLLLMFVAVPVILGVVIWFSLVFIFFRIMILLFNSYIKILLNIILAPLYLLFEAIPGQNAFSNWLKNMIGELITFPLVVGIFVLGAIIADTAVNGNLIQFPFLTGLDSKSFGFVIGMGLLFMTPDLVKSIRQIFIPKPGLLEGAGPGVFFGGATTAVSGGLGQVSQVAGLAFYLKPLQNILGKLPFGDKMFTFGDHPKPHA